jgi:Crinkler effector protein N-terminal domain
MTTTKVRCKLYIGKGDPEPITFAVNVDAVRDVDDLKKTIRAEVPILLAHCDAPVLKVFLAAATPSSIPDLPELDPLVEISSLNFLANTLIVVAPLPPQVRNPSLPH